MFHDTVYGWRVSDEHKLSNEKTQKIEEQVAEARQVFEEEFGDKKTTVDVLVTDNVQVEVFHTVDVWEDDDGTLLVDREVVRRNTDFWYIAEETQIGPNDVTIESDWETVPRE